jgi:hypothetical protein
MSVRNPKYEEIYYPESDGEPMAESGKHCNLLMERLSSLNSFFRADPTIYVGGNLFMYYHEGHPREMVARDLLVTRGIGSGPRRTYNVWVEGRPPDFILEISSPST